MPPPLAPGTFDLAVLDPPYDEPIRGCRRGRGPLLAQGGVLVLEHARRRRRPSRGTPRASRDVPSGDSALAFYAAKISDTA